LNGLSGPIGIDFYPTSMPAAKFATEPWYVNPIDREAFFHPFPQTVGRIRMFPRQPLRQLLRFRNSFFGVDFPGCSHQRFGLRLLILRQPFGHVSQLVLATPLHQARAAEHRIDPASNAFEPSITNRRLRSGARWLNGSDVRKQIQFIKRLFEVTA
jgi:hypothetical protein